MGGVRFALDSLKTKCTERQQTASSKNPANTSRIKHLVSMFPKAKFIYLHRDPVEVRLSTVRLFKALTQANSLQSFDHNDLDQETPYLHEAVIKAYEQQRSSIEDSNIVEVRYEDLVRDPLKTVRRIYTDLNIGGFDSSEPAFLEFITQQKDHRPHVYAFNDKQS